MDIALLLLLFIFLDVRRGSPGSSGSAPPKGPRASVSKLFCPDCDRVATDVRPAGGDL